MYQCQKCGKQVIEPYGSGKYCSRKCANSRTFSEESREKKRQANLGMKAYSNGEEVRYFKDSEIISEFFFKGNFKISKNYNSFEDFISENKIKIEKELQRKGIKYYQDICKEFIAIHNKDILTKYEELLASKAINKVFNIENTFIYAKYLSVTQNHPRSHEGHVFVHILLAEKLLDRPLTSLEIVHHKDHNKLNNSFDNIYIFNNKASHARFHYAKNYWLEIDNDVLVCKEITKDFLKQLIEIM